MPAVAASPSPQAEPSAQLQWISVRRDGETHLLDIDDVCYFRAEHKYVHVVTATHEALITTPLRHLLLRLDRTVFKQVRRGVVVNLRAVRSLVREPDGGLTLHLKARPEVLAVSSQYVDQFKQP